MRLLAVALSFSIFSTLGIAQAAVEDSPVSPATIQIGESVSGEIDPSSMSVDRYLILGSEYSDLVLEFAISGAEGQANLISKIVRSSDNSAIAQYSLGSSDEVQVRTLNALEAGEYVVTLESAGEEAAIANYTLTVNTEGTRSRGVYDGIWKVGDEGYAFVYQDGEALTVLILGNSPTLGYRWEAQSGSLEDNSAITDTVMGYVQLRLRYAFISPSEATITLLRCTVLDSAYPCLFPSGTIMPMTKVGQF